MRPCRARRGVPGAAFAAFPRPPGAGPLAASGIQGGRFLPPAAFLPVFDWVDPPGLPAGFLPRPLPRLLGGFDIARMLHVTRSGGCDRLVAVARGRRPIVDIAARSQQNTRLDPPRWRNW